MWSRAQEVSLKTRAELSNYQETSRYADVLAFFGQLEKESPLLHLQTFGRTHARKFRSILEERLGLESQSLRSTVIRECTNGICKRFLDNNEVFLAVFRQENRRHRIHTLNSIG